MGLKNEKLETIDIGNCPKCGHSPTQFIGKDFKALPDPKINSLLERLREIRNDIQDQAKQPEAELAAGFLLEIDTQIERAMEGE